MEDEPIHEQRTAAPAVRSNRRLALSAAAIVATCAAVGLGVWAKTSHARLRPDQALSAIPVSGASGSVVRTSDGKATLVVSGLVAAPAGKTYEAWVIRGGKAAPAGLFSGRNETAVVHLTRRVPRGAIVGVTLERAGGAAAPTGTPFVTTGAAS